MTLQKEIDKTRSVIKTDFYSQSIGEWISIYERDELDIHPEFQRFFRWTDTQKSKFIESILLGIPIPPIFVSQDKNGFWDVIDGLQRLSTIFEFVGILKDAKGKKKPPLKLEATQYMPSMEGKYWNKDNNNSFTPTQRLYIRRARLDASIILRESSKSAKYELFQRLNTGGSPLSEQEVRNCIIIMLDNKFYKWFYNLSQDANFQGCLSISDRAKAERYDMDLALRFILLRNMPKELLIKSGEDVTGFITDVMIEKIENKEINQKEEEEVFKKTFKYIYDNLGSQAFNRFVPDKNKFYGGFFLSAFEVIALGIGNNDGEPKSTSDDFKQAVKDVWSHPTIKKWSGAGKNAGRRLPRLLPLGRSIFSQSSDEFDTNLEEDVNPEGENINQEEDEG